MSDETIQVDTTTTPVSVDISSGSLKTSIIDNTTGLTAVVDASPVVASIVDERPYVTVRTGSGGSMDLTSIETLLSGRIDGSLMTAELAGDLDLLSDLWARIGTDLLLTYPDGVSIAEAGREYTTTSITDAVNVLEISVDGKISANTSLIQQTELAITQSVVNFQQDVAGNFTAQDTLITQTAASITSLATDVISNADNITIVQSDIVQEAARITLGVTAQEETDAAIITLSSRVTLTESTINLAVTAFNSASERLTAAELAITTNAVTASVSSSYLAQSLSAIETLLDNQWGVEVSEDLNGNTVVAGVSLLLHPTWLIGEGYAVDDTVYLSNEAYICILANIGDATNSPGNTTYWTNIPGGAKSVFSVNADDFNVSGPNGLTTVFDVNTTTGIVTINGSLVVDSVESDAWDSGTGAGFSLDPVTGAAEFRDMSMSFSNDSLEAVQTALNFANGADSTSYALENEDAIESAMLDGSTFISGGYINADFIKIGSAQIDDLSVTTAKISNLAVTAIQLGEDSVITEKIINNAVTVPMSTNAGSVTVNSTTEIALICISNFPSDGGDVLIQYNSVYGSAGDYATVIVSIIRQTTTNGVNTYVRLREVYMTFEGNAWSCALSCIDTGSTGVHTYYVSARQATSGTVVFNHQNLSLLSAKR